jgi:hypothetical protein
VQCQIDLITMGRVRGQEMSACLQALWKFDVKTWVVVACEDGPRCKRMVGGEKVLMNLEVVELISLGFF